MEGLNDMAASHHGSILGLARGYTRSEGDHRDWIAAFSRWYKKIPGTRDTDINLNASHDRM
jgi:hypothetical protein